MRERPILFSAPMVRAILDGSKTQTRRVVKLPVEYSSRWSGGWHIVGKAATIAVEMFNKLRGKPLGTDPTLCPYGQPGDRLWVRETWAFNPDHPGQHARAIYRADPECKYDAERWTPSIHMPRRASRILLEIVSVRVERLNDISGPDALAEGVSDDQVRRYLTRGSMNDGYEALRGAAAAHAFQALWESINGAGTWDTNPWVWVVEFKRVSA